ncbi:MAG: hypothetical protein K2X81_17950 [Candidatus Obscuribacterales bacterium]|nr:hypothetical protein [Candidatus Obscuribacterales bacterium]
MNKKLALALVVPMIVGGLLGTPAALAKKWTVTERIEKLSAEIDQGRKANELTVKEVTTLQEMVSSIKVKMEKMKGKNGGKLSGPDTKKLQDDMTDISVKMLKMRLDNVYAQ